MLEILHQLNKEQKPKGCKNHVNNFLNDKQGNFCNFDHKHSKNYKRETIVNSGTFLAETDQKKNQVGTMYYM